MLTLCAVLSGAKPAVTDCAWVIGTAQVLAVPVHAPDHPLKVEVAAGDTVSVTVVFGLKLLVHAVLQSIPAGALVTVPLPVPVLLTVNAICAVAKLAVTDWAWVIGTVQMLAVPVHTPDQPVKFEPAVATAVNVTLLP